MDLNGIMSLNDQLVTQTIDSVKKDKVESDSFAAALEKAQNDGDDKKLKEACIELESYFTKLMYKSMKNSVNFSEGGLFEKSSAEKMFEEMLDDELCERSAESGNGIGLAQMLYKQLKR